MAISAAGIYRITNLVNGKSYTGSGKKVERRLADHKQGTNSNVHLQNAIRKYGIENFAFDQIISVLDPAALLEYEQAAIDSVPVEMRYNISPTAGSCLGATWTHSEESRANYSAAALLRAADPKWREGIVEMSRARSAKPEYRAKADEAMRVKADDADHRKRLSERAKAYVSDPSMAARVTVNGCRVVFDGIASEFRSVWAAFLALGLPTQSQSVHIRFRRKLKLSGKEVFEHEGKQYLFELTQ
ncbi:GIY-YIG nuclease family protein [Caballeronia sp. EK]|uniref:GIY-YIG nuclease family protein n=1 Tax=Caballeronia sp. EK TaxID=2767469 RepID=UPI0016565F64|nr:GIY-YIG nuclease family protein [Caballeronia sp. EK]MBC8640177.1 GIY-YIG nuclease family protein [Caballeronia sp. EK]